MVPSTTEPADAAVPTVSWERSSSGRLRDALVHLGAGFFVGILVVAVVAVAFLAFSAATDGASDLLVVAVTLLLVGGPFSLLYLVTAHGAGDLRTLFPYVPDLRPTYVLLAAPFSIALLVGVLSLPYGKFLFVGVVIALQTAVAVRNATGELDVEDGTLRILTGPKPRSRDVRTLRSHRSWRVGSTHVVRLRYAGSPSFSRAPVLVVPESEFPAVDEALSEIESRDYGPDPSETSRAAKAALVAFALLFFGLVGLVAAVAGGGDEAPVMTSSVAIVGAFGVLFLVAAWAS
ncbi:hypothetical protein [Halopelagius longus]|uniref:Uncharacterized protein n=1 Tax=Halopelagius longus TaxID=1236180 RepID=A0A1H0XQT6_9EURY|nr:hypothetical protein [Halopelagius longus]RDI72021.1 hypothetical protein DWB78_09975 [Halopelagius longus]SDQ05141.1 hypothetical protein SAMN05216278_0100 [Halopelagius longus]